MACLHIVHMKISYPLKHNSTYAFNWKWRKHISDFRTTLHADVLNMEFLTLAICNQVLQVCCKE